MDTRLLNRKPKVTIIQRFDGRVMIIYPCKHKWEERKCLGEQFDNLESAKEWIRDNGLEVNVEHLHAGGVVK